MADLKDRYKKTIETLQKLAECAVCLELLKTPFKLCTRGHMMCCSCVETLTACPSCEAEFSIETPVAVRNLLEALPKLCRYTSEGCQDIVDSGSDHETYCGYRPEACREFLCESVVPVRDLLKHYKSEHPKCFIAEKQEQSILWPNFDPSKSRSDDVPVFLFGNFFFIVETVDIQEKQLKIKFNIVPNGKPVQDYYVCVEFKNENFRYCYTLKAFVNKSGDESKTVESDTSGSDKSNKADNQELYCMKIPTTELNRFINTEKKLKYSYTFFKEDLK